MIHGFINLSFNFRAELRRSKPAFVPVENGRDVIQCNTHPLGDGKRVASHNLIFKATYGRLLLQQTEFLQLNYHMLKRFHYGVILLLKSTANKQCGLPDCKLALLRPALFLIGERILTFRKL